MELVPVIVTVKLPVVAEELAVRDSVDTPGGVSGLGVKMPVTPNGRPVTVRVTRLDLPKLAPTRAKSRMFTVPSLLTSASAL